MLVLKALVEAGKVTPVIDRTYPLTEAAEAIRYIPRATPPARSSSRCEVDSTRRHPVSRRQRRPQDNAGVSLSTGGDVQ
jgi:Zinc-binding dehydrogenase